MSELNFPTDPDSGAIYSLNDVSFTYVVNAGWKKMPVRAFTMATLPDFTIPGQIIWVTDATPPVHAASNGTAWNVIGTNTPIA